MTTKYIGVIIRYRIEKSGAKNAPGKEKHESNKRIYIEPTETRQSSGPIKYIRPAGPVHG